MPYGCPQKKNSIEFFNEKYSSSNTALYLFQDNDEAIGVIGIKRTKQATAEILHIAVEGTRRNRGIGRQMIEELLKTEDISELCAETDKDAVDFYRRCGFTVRSLGEKYPGTERFLCTLKERP
ncbi:GNAT family N-acetyltransferase [Ferroacidibacillus organovorans]|uniref:N-acetyltransferase domain-containing protein n=1 Tax=Ferroacidibacillus organovorans TaxID=1765683 RepID=A0A1V4ER05_9BACL|nr:hypothetical protein B2M26_12945 [Ferroacidibacillus organovorans]